MLIFQKENIINNTQKMLIATLKFFFIRRDP